MYIDPIVNEVREIRERISEKNNFDIKLFFNDIRNRQVLLGTRLVCPEKKRNLEKSVSDKRGFDGLHHGR